MLDQLSNPYSQVISHAHSVDISTAVAFLALQKPTNDNPINKPVGFSIVRLIGDYYQQLECAEAIDLELEPARVIDFILNWSKVIKFSICYTDLDNYLLFAHNNLWQLKAKIFSKNNPEYKAPRLTAIKRLDDLVLRQQHALTEPINTKHLGFAKSLSNSKELSNLNLVGKFPRFDALAGATEQAIKIQKNIYGKITNEQRRIAAANGKSIW